MRDNSKESSRNKAWSFIASMRVGIVLLIIVAGLSIFGTVIPQEQGEGVYFQIYSDVIARVILTTGLDNVFEVWWYLLAGALLCINLIACSINRFPGIYRSVFKPRKKLNEKSINNLKNSSEIFFNTDQVSSKEKIKNVLQQYRYNLEEVEDDENRKEKTEEDFINIFASKGRVGYFGSFITHISFLILILGFMYGNLTGFDTHLGGIPGDVISMKYMDFDLRIEDFEIDYRDDYSVNQYYSTITVLEEDKEVKNETIYVNRPLRYEGINFYQSSYGWVGKLRIEDEKNYYLDTVEMYEEGSYHYPLENLVVHLRAFYPDFDHDEEGRPVNRSPMPNNPRFVWTLQEGDEVIDMMVSKKGETFEYEDIEFTFTDYDQYTVFKVNRDPSIPVFYFGSGLMIIGLVLSFLFSPRKIWVILKSGEDAKSCRALIGGQTFKNEVQFEEDFSLLVDNIKKNDME